VLNKAPYAKNIKKKMKYLSKHADLKADTISRDTNARKIARKHT